MLIRNTCCLQKGNVTSFRGYLGHPVIDLRVQNSVKSICIHRSILAELWFSKTKASFLENRVCKKRQVKVTLFPGMVFQERILF